MASEAELIAELRKLDCRDNSCRFAENKTGQRTNGGCTCLSSLPWDLRRVLERIHFHYMRVASRRAAQDGGAES